MTLLKNLEHRIVKIVKTVKTFGLVVNGSCTEVCPIDENS